jgi:hypothetical protein
MTRWRDDQPQTTAACPEWARCAFVRDDGGRAAAGHRGTGPDCVARAIAIGTNQEYSVVRAGLDEMAKRERPRTMWREGKGWITKRRSDHTRNGVNRATIKRYLIAQGWTFTPTMSIGSGCKVHLRADELPMGRLILSVSKHYVAVVDHAIRDLSDCSRQGTRCVYGYWSKP